jgi:hypothetical protein
MESRSTDAYEIMHARLDEIASEEMIDISITNLFEEFIIEILAKITQKVHACQFGRYDERHTYIAVAMDFNAATLTQLLALNDQFTGLELLDVTTEAHDRITHIPSEILDHPHFIIRMNSAIIDSEILPRLKKYLQNDDRDELASEFILRYANLSYPSKRVNDEFNAMFISNRRPLYVQAFCNDHDTTQRNRTVVETLCELTKEKIESTKKMHDEFDNLLLSELISIVNLYAYGVDSFLDASFQTVVNTAYSELQFSHLFYTCFIIAIPATSALAIHNFFSTFGGSRACILGQTIEIKQENKTIECQTLLLRNSVLASPAFLAEMKRHNQRPEKLDQYHEKTALEYAKYLNDLLQKGIPSTHPLSTSIARLTAHIKEHPLEKRADTDEYFKTVQDDAKNFAETKSTPGLFSNPNQHTTHRVCNLLEALTKIMEKKFHPLVCKKS